MRQRAPPALFAARVGVEAAGLAVRFDLVQLGEVLERDGGSLVLGEQRCVELGADVHAAAEPPLGRHGDLRLSVVVLDLARVAGVAVALDEAIDGGEPVRDLGRFPAGRVAVGDELAAAGRAIGADEAPDVAAERAVSAALVERLEVRVVGTDDVAAEDERLGGDGDGLDEIGGVGPVRLQRLVRDVEPEPRELAALPVERQPEHALVGDELGEQRGVDLAHDGGRLRARRDRHVLAAVLAGRFLAPLHVDDDVGGT